MTGARVNLNLEVGSRSKVSELKLVLKRDFYSDPFDPWLENFAYHIDLTPLVFICSGLIALCIAWVTVGGTAAKAASAKPVVALRYE